MRNVAAASVEPDPMDATGWRAVGLWIGAAVLVRAATGWLLADARARAAAGDIAADGVSVYGPAAVALANGEGYVINGSPVTSHVPGYPLVLALVLAVAPSLETAVLTVQVVGGALVGGGIYLLGALLFGSLAGHVAAAIALVFPDLIAYSLLNLSETPQLLCILGAAVLALRVLRGASALTAGALGLALGLGTLMRESTVLFAGIWWALLLAVPWASPRVRVGRVGIAAAVFVLVLTPWWVRNVRTLGEFVPLSSKGVRNVYLGTLIRPYPVTDYRNRGIVFDPDEVARDQDVRRRANAASTLAARDRVFLEAAVDNVRRDPVGQLGHVGRKAWFLWTPNVAPRHADRVGLPWVLWAAAAFYLGVLGAGLVGLWRARRHRDVVVVLVAPLLVNTLFHVFVGIAEPRDHFPVLPALLIGAAALLTSRLPTRQGPAPPRLPG